MIPKLRPTGGPGKTQRGRGVDVGCENICKTVKKLSARKKGWAKLLNRVHSREVAYRGTDLVVEVLYTVVFDSVLLLACF